MSNIYLPPPPPKLYWRPRLRVEPAGLGAAGQRANKRAIDAGEFHKEY